VSRLSILLSSLLLPGCVVFTARFGAPLPGAAAVAALQPGVTTRAEAVALLGPPEEYRTPRDFEAFRSQDVRRLMVRVERDALHRRRLTWIEERRVTRGFWLLPGFPLLHLWDTGFEVDTLVVLFDERERVEAVARARSGLEPDETDAATARAASAATAGAGEGVWVAAASTDASAAR